MSIVCWGELLWDLYPDGKRLGGAPANVAYHLAVLGEAVTLATRVGDDELGRDAIAAMKAAGVDTSLIQIDPERPTGAVGIEIHDGEPSYTLHPGCAWERIEATDEVREALATAKVLCFGSLSQIRDEGKTNFRQALSATAKTCVKICDINLRPGYVDAELARWHLDAATVVKLNDKEAELLEHHLGAEQVAEYLGREAGVQLIALTRGPAGSNLSMMASGNRLVIHDHPGFAAAPGGDNVGAGDAFTAVLARAAARGLPLGPANIAANRYASYVASQRGATPAIPAELIKALDRG